MKEMCPYVLYQRCEAILDSCKHRGQRRTALRFIRLAQEKINREKGSKRFGGIGREKINPFWDSQYDRLATRAWMMEMK